MSVRTTLSLWDQAQIAFDDDDLHKALEALKQLQAPSAKHLFNIGSIQLLLGDATSALQHLNKSIEKDQHLAVGYFLRGHIYYKLNRFNDACGSFEDCHTHLRGNNMIDYKQLGLQFKLYACEILYNMASCHSKLKDFSKASHLLREAKALKGESRHKCIADALSIAQAHQTFLALDISKESHFFRPPKSKTANLAKKDYLGKAKVVASVEENDTFSGFSGPKLLETGKLNVISRSLPNSPVARRNLDLPKPEMRSKSPQPRCPRPVINDADHENVNIHSGRPDPPIALPTRLPKGNQTKQIGVETTSLPVPCLTRPPVHDSEPKANLIGELVAQMQQIKPIPKPRPVRPQTPPTGLFTVEFQCGDSLYCANVTRNMSLKELERIATEKYGFLADSMDLWYQPPSGDSYHVCDDSILSKLYSIAIKNNKLKLFCYAKF